VEELFGEALHFPVNGEDEAVNGLGSKRSSRREWLGRRR
jgi:hypothetical protein